MSELFRDPRYVIPLAMLIFVIVVSAAMGAGPSAVDSAVPEIPFVPRQEESAAPPSAELMKDYQRAVDLGNLHDAALAVRERTGAFPSTNGAVVELCASSADRGCTIREARGLASGDGEFPYYYASDGATYATFVARAETQGDTSRCPAPLPAALESAPVMCVRVEAPQ